jgi:hypothetical protein
MKTLALFLLLCGLLASGCELQTRTDNTAVNITDGQVSSFATKQGDYIITSNTGLTNSTLR